jgi:hypothetical protein
MKMKEGREGGREGKEEEGWVRREGSRDGAYGGNIRIT